LSRRRIHAFSANPQTADLDAVARQVASGALRAAVDRVHPLDDIASAHRAFDGGGVLGKQVVTVPA
jgi:NADPH:quinone reductase-like Zn-dependent oxidoreductase